MSELTKELRHENYLIIQILNNAKRLNMRTLIGRRALFDHKDEILAHFKKEDEKIHALLNNAVQSHPDLKQSMEMFKKDIQNTTKSMQAFFLKYDSTHSSKELCDHFDTLFKIIKHRIEKEENIFYAEFDEIEAEEEMLKNMML